MPNPPHLIVSPIALNGQGEPVINLIDTAGMVPVRGVDINGDPDRVLLLVSASTDGQYVSVRGGSAPPAMRAALGNLSGPMLPCTFATLTTEMAGEDNDLTLVAVRAGQQGNALTLTLIDPEAPGELGVSVTDGAIEVTLAYADDAITSTAQDVVDAINDDDDARALVTAFVAEGNTGLGLVTALDETALHGGSGGVAVLGPFEPSRFEQYDGSLWIDFEPNDGTLAVLVGLLPRVR